MIVAPHIEEGGVFGQPFSVKKYRTQYHIYEYRHHSEYKSLTICRAYDGPQPKAMYRAVAADGVTMIVSSDLAGEKAAITEYLKNAPKSTAPPENQQNPEQACQRRYPVHLLNKCKKSVENQQEIVKCPYCGIPITGDESTMIITTSTGTKWHYECAMEKYHELRGNEL